MTSQYLSSSPAADMCEETYGVLPCTTTVLGNLFLVIAYGYLNYKVRVTCMTAGSELLMEIITGSGIIRHTHVVTVVLPLLAALPDSLLVLASGLSGSKEKAQNKVLIGMGLLAGSTIFLLTLVWGTCVVAGKCDLRSDPVAAIDSQDTGGFSFTGSGISTDAPTSKMARIMAICVLPFAVALFPTMLGTHSGHRGAILLASILSFLLVLFYCLYQGIDPWIQKRRIAYAKLKHVVSGILRYAQTQALGRLLNDDGTPNESVIKKFFHKIDDDENNSVSRSELHALLLGMNLEENDFDKLDDVVDLIMTDFHTVDNDTIEEAEFVDGIKRWLNEAKRRLPASGAFSNESFDDYCARTREQYKQLYNDGSNMPAMVERTIENQRWCVIKAAGLILVGTAIPAAFAEPLVDAIYGFSKAARVPSFFISFVALPLVNNLSEAISAVHSMRKKRKWEASLTLSEVYSVVTVNNLMCLGVFLSLVYVRDIPWEFTPELLIILLVCIAMGLFSSFRTTFPLWTCIVAYLLYPLSIIVAYILDYVFHCQKLALFGSSSRGGPYTLSTDYFPNILTNLVADD